MYPLKHVYAETTINKNLIDLNSFHFCHKPTPQYVLQNISQIYSLYYNSFGC